MKERISVFDVLKIGVGPSSSHTLGPWRAAERFLKELKAADEFDQITHITVDLFGSLAQTGKGHATDVAVLMGLLGEDPVTCDTTQIHTKVDQIRTDEELNLNGERFISFRYQDDLIFHFDQTLSFHPNGIRFTADLATMRSKESTYFSIGGGFVIKQGELIESNTTILPYPCDTAEDVRQHCTQNTLSISEMVYQNERQWRTNDEIQRGLLNIWSTMAQCIYRGCHTNGILPGGLNVARRAQALHQRLIGDATYQSCDEWLEIIKSQPTTFQNTVKWVSCFAIAVNEENAALGRVVTAPTNGSSGTIPAVLMYYIMNFHPSNDDIVRFLLVAGEIGSLFKKGATISAALGGCQAEIGVSSAMAAAALTECLGGSVGQALMAAEIAMEHHLGMTCDPIAGLVQIPCIERNAMGAMKAITATEIALNSDPEQAKVPLDAVIKTMWETAQDMNDRYKETSEGGLAINIPVNVIEC